jgi:hypothetical protein
LNWLDHPEDGGWTKSLLTNAGLMGINQHSTNNRQIVREGNLVVWGADDSRNHDKYIGVFNLGTDRQAFDLPLADLELPGGSYRVSDLWEGGELGPIQGAMQVTVPGHGAKVYRLRR